MVSVKALKSLFRHRDRLLMMVEATRGLVEDSANIDNNLTQLQERGISGPKPLKKNTEPT